LHAKSATGGLCRELLDRPREESAQQLLDLTAQHGGTHGAEAAPCDQPDGTDSGELLLPDPQLASVHRFIGRVAVEVERRYGRVPVATIRLRMLRRTLAAAGHARAREEKSHGGAAVALFLTKDRLRRSNP
jgi:hypothetical protein